MAAAGIAATQNTATLNVTANVVKNCDITTADVVFGTYDPLGANLNADKDGTGSITARCTLGEAPKIELSVPAGGRKLAGPGANALTYELYKDGAHLNVWSTGTGAQTAPAFSTDAPQTFTVYGRITRGQNVPAGSYSHQLTVTLNF